MDLSFDGFIASPSLTFTSFETIDETLEYALFLNMGILALGQDEINV